MTLCLCSVVHRLRAVINILLTTLWTYLGHVSICWHDPDKWSDPTCLRLHLIMHQIFGLAGIQANGLGLGLGVRYSPLFWCIIKCYPTCLYSINRKCTGFDPTIVFADSSVISW